MRYLFIHKMLLILFLLFCITTVILTLPNGGYECIKGICGLVMVDTYFHDAFWHIALSATAFDTLPFRMPIFAGELLQGYHYVYDLLLSIAGSIGISPVFFYWRITPVLYVFLITIVIVKLARKTYDSPLFIALFLILLYFGGTASFIASLLNYGTLFGHGVSSLLHTSTVVLYPTVGASFIIFFTTMYILQQKKRTRRHGIVTGLLLFICMGIKFYAGTGILILLTVFELAELIKKKETGVFLRNNIIYFIFFTVSLVIFYRFPWALQNEPVFTFAPLATVHQIIEDEHIYKIPSLTLARQTLLVSGTVSPRLLFIEITTMLLFLLHHFGTRLIGFIYLFHLILSKKAKSLDYACAAVIIILTSAGMLFIQRGDQWWNSLQFLYYSAVLGTFYTARFLYDMVCKYRKAGIIFAVVVVILSVPDTFEKIGEIYRTQKRIIPQYELDALSFLKKQPDGVVFSVPLLSDTAYISALSHKQLYYADEQMLRNTGVAYKKRKEYLMRPEDVDLNQVNARYVYIVKTDRYSVLFFRKAKGTSYSTVFENKKVIIMARKK